MIKFIDGNGNVLVEYDSVISSSEITATKELLEYENGFKVSVEMEGFD